MGKKRLVVLAAALAVLFLARGAVANAAVRMGVKAVTGLRLEMRRLEVGLFRSQIHVTGMRLHNPAGFREKIMADVPELYVDADLPGLLRGKTHLRELRLDFQELLVEKNREGKTNLDSLKGVQETKKDQAQGRPVAEKARKPFAFQIDKLRLKVGKVVYKDYSQGEPPMVREFRVNIDEEYSNIHDTTGLASLIVTRALVKTTVANLANFDLRALENQALQALRIPREWLGGTVGQKAGDAADALKKLLPFGGGEQPQEQQ